MARHALRREHLTADNASRTVQAHIRYQECVAKKTDENRTRELEGNVRRGQNYWCGGFIERGLGQVHRWDGGCKKYSCQEEPDESPIVSPQGDTSVPNRLGPPPQRSNCQNY